MKETLLYNAQRRLIKSAFLAIVFLQMATAIQAQRLAPTWVSDIQCILYSHCAPCHNPEGSGPMSLLDYETASLFAPIIAHRIQLPVAGDTISGYHQNRMPQWKVFPADQFIGDLTMTDQEIDIILRWVEAGAPIGDTTAVMLPMPDFNNEIEADTVIRMPNFTVPPIADDIVFDFPIASRLDTTIFITAAQFVPGAPSGVHHAFGNFFDSPIPFMLDSLYPGPGYSAYGGSGAPVSVIVPYGGFNAPIVLPEGFGIEFDKNSDFMINVHYPVYAAGETDSSKLLLQYTTEPQRRINIGAAIKMGFHPVGRMINGIYVGQSEWSVLPGWDSLILRRVIKKSETWFGVGLHAHQVCEGLEVYYKRPGDNQKRLMVSNPDWDPFVQSVYLFKKPLILPKDTEVWLVGTYWNTASNPRQTIFPPDTMFDANSQLAEMQIAISAFARYEEGDELLVMDTTTHTPHHEDCIPRGFYPRFAAEEEIEPLKGFYLFNNPTSGSFLIRQYGFEENPLLEISNSSGQLIYSESLFKEYSTISLPSNLPSGVYFAKIAGMPIQKLIVS